MCQGPEAGMNLACLSNNKEASKVRGKLIKVIEEKRGSRSCGIFLIGHCQGLSFTSSDMDSYWKILSRRVILYDIFQQGFLAAYYSNSQSEACCSFLFCTRKKKSKLTEVNN